jgi:Carbamoyl-phosphate synthase L chain, ATP binding domain
MSGSIDLVVPNIADFNLRHPALRHGPGVEQAVVRAGRGAGDQSAFWSTGDRVLILPTGYDPCWFDDIHGAQGLAVPPVICPAERTGLLVKDLLLDGASLAALRERLAGHPVVRLLAWGATPDLFPLAATLQGWGHELEADGVAEDSYWASLYLESKMSCLDLARHVPEVRVPRAITVTCWEELRGALTAMLGDYSRVIVKSPHGAGGEGTAVVRAGGRGLESFLNTAHREAFFRSFPLFVQEHVEHAEGVDCPAVDLRVDADGVAEILVSAMTVDGYRVRSVNVGAGAVPAAEAERILRVGRRIGLAARDLGFRGWLCVDYLVSAGGDLYVTEINARRSGAMAAISLLQRWQAYSRLTVFSHDTFAVSLPAPVSYREHIRPVFRGLWRAGVLAYPTGVRGLAQARPTIGLLTAAATATEAEQIAAGIGRLLNTVAQAG